LTSPVTTKSDGAGVNAIAGSLSIVAMSMTAAAAATRVKTRRSMQGSGFVG
jgi:hypothetical protein